jgi:hypothetical protein
MWGPIIVGLAVLGMIVYYMAGEQKDVKSWCEARDMVMETVYRRVTCVDRQGKAVKPYSDVPIIETSPTRPPISTQ